MRLNAAFVSLFLLGAQTNEPTPSSDGTPVTGQPAADVLASGDSWGNPTFIGGLTNAGPTSHSVW